MASEMKRLFPSRTHLSPIGMRPLKPMEITAIMLASLLVLPFLIMTPWIEVQNGFIVGRPHLTSPLWSVSTTEAGNISLKLNPYHEIGAFLILSFPNLLFVYAINRYSQEKASRFEVAVTGFLGPVLFTLMSLPSVISFLAMGYVVVIGPIPLLQIAAVLLLCYRNRSMNCL